MKIKCVSIAVALIVLISSCEKFPDIGKPYKLEYIGRSNRIAILDINNTYIINGPILQYKFNDRFIIASERPFDSIPECASSNRVLRKCEEAFDKSTFEQYWIIDKSNNNLLGPFNQLQMKSYFIKLDISNDLLIE